MPISARPRVVSLLPGATEMVVAMGGRDQLVGISHECDWPPDITSLPRVTTTPIDPRLGSGAIHVAVQQAVAAGRAVIGVDAEALRALAPDVIVTQMLCDVCAVADGEAMRLAQAMAPPPQVISLNGGTLAGVREDIRRLGSAIGRGAEAAAVAAALTEMVRVDQARNGRGQRPRVVAIEWLDPLFLAGHWVPEMIAAAGGIDVGATAGSHSVVREWSDIIALDPDLVLVILCGFGLERARAELAALDGTVAGAWLASRRVVVLDGNAFTSRPGPRLVDGIRQMAAAFRE
ncbi:MAG: ABC transporter substrate-binding protein [Gemmatimonadales bacterium]